jgi:cytochrome b561
MTEPALFSRPYRWIHWIMALLIVAMLVFGQRFATEMTDADRTFSLAGHSSLGVLVVLLLAIRIAMRVTGAAKRPAHPLPPLMATASKAVQYGLYALMIYLPVTGILAARVHTLPVTPFGAFNVANPNEAAFAALRPWHEFGTKALMLLLALHIGAALYHAFVRKDRVMRAMNPFAR